MKKKIVLTVGNALMGDDAAGPLLAQALQRAPVEAWEVIDGGAMPENCLHHVREAAPEHVLIVDSADMDLAPGALRLIQTDHLEDPFVMTTHTLPLSYLAEALREFVPRVDLLGIQPRWVAFGYPVSDEVRQAVRQVCEDLRQTNLVWPCL